MRLRTRRAPAPVFRGAIWTALSILIAMALINAALGKVRSTMSSLPTAAEVTPVGSPMGLWSAGQVDSLVAELQTLLRRNMQLERSVARAEADVESGQAAADSDDVPDLAALEEEQRRLVRELQDLETKIDRDMDMGERTRATVDSLQQAIGDLQVRIDSSDTTDDGTVNVLGLHGSRHLENGEGATFAECKGGKLRMEPGSVELAGNPTSAESAAFLRAVRTTGYVLFLVRPDGFNTFDQYREVLQDANQNEQSKVEFGFEPVDQDWHLTFPSVAGR